MLFWLTLLVVLLICVLLCDDFGVFGYMVVCVFLHRLILLLLVAVLVVALVVCMLANCWCLYSCGFCYCCLV